MVLKIDPVFYRYHKCEADLKLKFEDVDEIGCVFSEIGWVFSEIDKGVGLGNVVPKFSL